MIAHHPPLQHMRGHFTRHIKRSPYRTPRSRLKRERLIRRNTVDLDDRRDTNSSESSEVKYAEFLTHESFKEGPFMWVMAFQSSELGVLPSCAIPIFIVHVS
eukprot:Gb_37251 [translate_table: standard]